MLAKRIEWEIRHRGAPVYINLYIYLVATSWPTSEDRLDKLVVVYGTAHRHKSVFVVVCVVCSSPLASRGRFIMITRVVECGPVDNLRETNHIVTVYLIFL